ncbi:SUPPRESSOR OF GAMMA RESPONSE 1-like isoform X2 [Malania oleifera]|uniref:SUPPRESSOR OF GAMMA RESPONSE 1-like isoform X2 n=1 Tax=Malania oleifera TaxID=397392 RepID=UPI0025AE5FC3|nr:SUPPRESSOR OF GAMMA RESPONSE 1-like isoform X2 [Malania oleifera]
MSWLIDSRGLAKKVKCATLSAAYQIKDCGANRECPKCHCRIDNSDVSTEWPGLPAGVKFDPSDAQLLEHLAAKCGVGNSKPHMFIDEFIPTLEGDKGICYTHPENLPGAKKDGNSVHFFHRTINAYATGQRKRRKIHSQNDVIEEHVRWHKTGKTKPVLENGIQKGCKKIMVLYRSSKKGIKPNKSKWVMHQYHLGMEEDEKEGEYVVSKIFYQHQKQNDKDDINLVIEQSDMGTIRTSPRTPKTNTPNPPRPGKSISCDDVADDNIQQASPLEAEVTAGAYQRPFGDDLVYPEWLAGESQAVDNLDQNGIDDELLCKEIFGSYTPLGDPMLNPGPFAGHDRNDFFGGDKNATCGIADLENLELDTPPDFQLADLQFGSQDSILGWLDRM